MQYISTKKTKTKYNIIIRYKNNRDKEYFYTKYFTSESNASNYCMYRLNNPKVFSCVFNVAETVNVVGKSVKDVDGNILRAIPNKPNYYMDAEGYKYYINNGVRIKSKETVK